jgi:hypothetical protein
MLVKGKSHKDGGIQAVYGASKRPIELEGGEVVINKDSVESDKVFYLDGIPMFPKEILNTINTMDGNGAPIPIDVTATELKELFGDGGQIPSRAYDADYSDEWFDSVEDLYDPIWRLDCSGQTRQAMDLLYAHNNKYKTSLPTILIVAIVIQIFWKHYQKAVNGGYSKDGWTISELKKTYGKDDVHKMLIYYMATFVAQAQKGRFAGNKLSEEERSELVDAIINFDPKLLPSDLSYNFN